MKKNKIGFIVSNYAAGSPIGPMLTSRLYLEEIFKGGIVGPTLCITPKNSDKENIIKDFYLSENLDVVGVDFRLPIPLRIASSMRAIFEVYNLYKKCDYVHVFWYPGVIHLLPRFLIKRTFFTMMDSQFKLIKETSRPKSLIEKIVLNLRLSIYKRYESKIHENSLLVNYVSLEDVSSCYRDNTNLVITKLPTYNDELAIFKADKRIQNKILIPRPDPVLLRYFIEELNKIKKCSIEILANFDLDERIKKMSNVKHIRYIDNYDSFYAQGGLVVLLDAGGAGTTNRSLAACRHSLPFISTVAALRGHSFNFVNALTISDDIKKLAKSAAENIDNIRRIESDELSDYLKLFKARNASAPLIKKIAAIISE